MITITKLALRHRRLVALLWLVVAVAGFASVGPATSALSDQYSVPGREGYVTNTRIKATFGNGGDGAPLVAVVTLPRGVDAGSAEVRAGLTSVSRRIAAAVPHTRIASFASTGDRAFVSRDGRTTFVVAYPPPTPGSFGQNEQAVDDAKAALRGTTVADAPVHLTGLNALSASSGTGGGTGLLAESLLGGVGALLVLAFVFASLMAFVPLVVAVISIMASFLLVWALTSVTQVSGIVGFLIALVGLGVAIDYSLLIVVRWREARAHGYAGDDAVVHAMATAGRAVVFSGTTVAIGLLALIALPVPFLRSVGYGGMVIPLVSLAVATTLLPVILSKMGGRLDWPHLRTDDRASRSWTRWGALVVRHRLAAAAVAAAVLGALLFAATTIDLGAATGDPDTIVRSGDARQGLDALERSGIGAGALTPIEVVARGGQTAQLVTRLAHIDGIQGAAAPAAAAWHRGSAAVVDVFARSDSSATVDRVRDAAHAAGGDVRVGGIVAQNDDFISAVYGASR